MGIESSASLLIAAMDLKLVRLLRAAMNGGTAGGPAGITPGPRFKPRPVHHPEPRIEPRKVIHPTPRFEPRPVHHPEPRIEARDCPPAPAPSPSAKCAKSVLPPPWKMPIRDMPVEPRPVIKRVVYQVDTVHKGSLIDFFI